MTEFTETHWADEDFSREFRDSFEPLIFERERHIDIVKSLYSFFVRRGASVLDLGCGDGKLAQEILKADPSSKILLVDGSEDMIRAAQKRLGSYSGVSFLKASFQELMELKPVQRGFDFALSSLAVHHLDSDEKRRFFKYVAGLLNKGGFFVIVDVVLADPLFEDWYIELWRRYVRGRFSDSRKDAELEKIIKRHRDRSDNRLESVEVQLRMLEDAGFGPVDCFYKYGLFAVFGARVQAP